jgi:hypothetical protein
MGTALYFAFGWLAALVLAAHAGVSVPDGFGLAILVLTLWSVVYLYVRLCRRWPIAGWIGLGFLAGLFGASRPIYIRNEITVDDDGNEVAVYDDNCDAVIDDAYYDGGSSDSRGD